MTKTKSPLGRCCIALDTEEKADRLMEACEKHEFDFGWAGGEPPIEYKFWENNGKNTAVCFGWNKDDWNNETNRIAYADKQYFKKHGGKFISFKKAMELFGREEVDSESGRQILVYSC